MKTIVANMFKNPISEVILVFASLLWQIPVQAQTVQGDILRGQGAFAKGAGWYNFNTARGNAINVATMRNYNQEVRLNYRNRVLFWAEKKAGKKLSKEEAAKRADERIRQLRVAPTGDDINSGDALNVMMEILTDPGIKQNDWYMKSISLPEAATVKDMVFHYYPKGNDSPGAYKVEIAISRLGKDVDWPVFMKNDEFKVECANYETTVTKLRVGIQNGKVELGEFKNIDQSLENLKNKVKLTLDDKRGYKRAGLDFTEKLVNASRLFDGNNVDYGQELLQETDKYDARTVGELVAFMLKYRLMFADSESPSSTRLYSDLYTVMDKQATALGINPRDMPAVNPQKVDEASALFKVGSVWVWTARNGVKIRMRVTRRNGETFQASQKSDDGAFDRDIRGTIKDGEISWLRKDVDEKKGNVGPPFRGVIDTKKKIINGNMPLKDGGTVPVMYSLAQ